MKSLYEVEVTDAIDKSQGRTYTYLVSVNGGCMKEAVRKAKTQWKRDSWEKNPFIKSIEFLGKHI